MKQIIFAAMNDKGEPLLDFAIRKEEICTARKSTKLKEGDKVRLIRKYRGKHEAEGYVRKIKYMNFWWPEHFNYWLTYWRYSGFTSPFKWLKVYLEINDKPNLVWFIYITNIRRLK